MKYSYLETRSRRVNTSFVISTWFSLWLYSQTFYKSDETLFGSSAVGDAEINVGKMDVSFALKEVLAKRRW